MQRAQNICIVGLGYVGLPLAHAFANVGHTVIGYDVSTERIAELQDGRDRTNELTSEELAQVSIEYTTDPTAIGKATFVILAIPTPVDEQKKPDLTLVERATETVAKHMQDGAIIIYESTVYPGVTEEFCGSILQKSGKKFRLGYSPERVNPGDKEHTITKIMKVVAGEDAETTDLLCDLYGSIVTAGIHRAPSIKVAEMAKAIENAQRDLNIAYVNEIALLCEKIGIGTQEVLEAAGTKWNFLPFQPGLVGGHCIGVDPYYLLEKAEQYHLEMPIVSAARKINDGMADHVAKRILAALRERGKDSAATSVLVLGMTFKENVPDFRNSQSPRVVKALEAEGCNVTTHDPYAAAQPSLEKLTGFDALVLLVPHREYRALSKKNIQDMLRKDGFVFDVKGILHTIKKDQTSFSIIQL